MSTNEDSQTNNTPYKERPLQLKRIEKVLEGTHYNNPAAIEAAYKFALCQVLINFIPTLDWLPK